MHMTSLLLSPILMLFLSCFGLNCGGGKITRPIDMYGGIDGYIYAPVGSQLVSAKVALSGTPQPGFAGLPQATITASCGTTGKNTQTQSGDNAGYFSLSGLPVGNCSLAISKNGYTTNTTTVLIIANSTVTVGGAAGLTINPSSSGSVEITSNISGGEIVIDGQETGIVMSDTIHIIDNLSTGIHSFSLTKSGFNEAASQNINIENGGTSSVELMLYGSSNKIYFVSERNSDFDNEEFVLELFSMNPDGTDQNKVGDIHAGYVAASVDGSFLLYSPSSSASDEDKFCSIFKINIDGTNKLCILAANTILSTGVILSYDGNTVGTLVDDQECSETHNSFYCSELYTMRTNGLNLTRITNNAFSDYIMAFSPDGSKMVFGSSRKSLVDPDVYIINSDGTNESQLTDDDKSRSPSFSPNGTKILFQSWRSGNTDIYTMNVDGTTPVNISNSLDLAEENPYYSPDGTKIIFTVFIDVYYKYDVFIMDADGSNKTRLTYSRGNDYGISW